MVCRKRLEQMIRVNHAGEYGAKQIYKGQMRSLNKNVEVVQILKEMADQEEEHLKAFQHLIVQEKVRPTLLQPLWHIAGYSLGFVSGLLGEKVAHACTIAIEEVIEDHYEGQLDELNDDHPALSDLIRSCQQDEIEHKNKAEEYGGKQAHFFPVLSSFVKAGSRLAIFLSQRV